MQQNIVETISSGSREFSRARPVSAFLLLSLTGAWLIAASAQLRVDLMPYSLVPITAQSLVVLLIGYYFRTSVVAGSTCGYLALGALGIPVFASKSAGIAWLTGATGGYLAGFVLAALAISALKPSLQRLFKSEILSATVLFLIGKVVILGLGVAWLSRLVGFDASIATGLVPFLPGMVIKLALAVSLVVGATKVSELLKQKF